MRTIGLIDPSPSTRARLAARLRSEFTVLEGEVLSPAIATAGTSLIVAAAEAVPPRAPWEPPFAALPFLIFGGFPAAAAGRAAPLRVVGSPVDGAALARHAQALLNEAAPGTTSGTEMAIGPPFLPEAVASVLRRAVRAHRARLPVLIVGEPGAGKRTAARALHRLSGYGELVRLTPLTAVCLAERRAPPWLAASSEPIVMLADGIDAFPGESEAALVECLAEGGSLRPIGAPRPFWLLATTAADLAALADLGRFDAALAAQLTDIVIELPPLRSRPEAIASVARRMLAEVGDRFGVPLSLAPAAAARLEQHPWPRNLAELRGVLRRAALWATGASIGPDELLFAWPAGTQSPVAPAAEAASAAARDTNAAPVVHATNDSGERPETDTAAGDRDRRLELVLTELAHELRNPMVTIKTFASHLPALLEDAELRQRFATLTDEAIARMDGLLENVLDFARLGPPRPQAIALVPVLDHALAAVGDQLEERAGRIRREGWERGPRVLADETQLRYAFENLFAALVSELPSNHELCVRIGDNGALALRFVGLGGVTAKLQSFLHDSDGVPAPTVLPLRFVLARSVIVRNGGEVAVESGPEEETLVTVGLQGSRHVS